MKWDPNNCRLGNTDGIAAIRQCPRTGNDHTKTTKSGKPIFIAGANVTERTGWSSEQVKKHVRWQRQTWRICEGSSLSCDRGRWACLGMGNGISHCGRLPNRNPNARFALPETGIGILPVPAAK